MVGTASKDSLGYETFKLIGIVAEVYSRISTKPGIFYHFIVLLYTSSVLHFQPFSILHLKPVQSYTSNLFNPTLPSFSILHFQPFLSYTSNLFYPTLPTFSILHFQPFISLYTTTFYLSYTSNPFYPKTLPTLYILIHFQPSIYPTFTTFFHPTRPSPLFILHL